LSSRRLYRMGRESAQPPVICVHGLARNGRDFDYLARALEADRQVFCPDIAGRGRGDWFASPADYGGGMWDLLASGPRAQRQRHAIVEAIAPIWEANHVWLILVIVLLFSAFPRAFSGVMTALNIPI